MGSMKEKMINDSIDKRDAEIAHQLGITHAEFSQTDWDFVGEDEPFGPYIQFYESSPKEILDKIQGLGDDRRIAVNL